MRHHLSGPFLRLTRFIAPEMLECLRKLDSLRRSAGGSGRPGVGIASSGTLVGAGFRRSRAVDCREREDAEELDGESSEDVGTS